MMNPKSIAVDFDGTLAFDAWPNIGEPNTALINFLIEWKKSGNKVVLWTCRAGAPLEEAVTWCTEHGLYFDAINENLPEIIQKYGTDSRKITCDLYIDDRGIRPEQICSEQIDI